MWSEGRVPAHPTAEERPMKRHHTARYYVHRVKESLTTRVSKLICAVVLGLLFLIGIISFILWLSLRPHRPRFFVEGFSIPAGNSFIFYNVTARNSNQNIGVYYDSVEVAVFYQDDQRLGGAQVLYPFYQEPKNTTVIAGALGGAALNATGRAWEQIAADRARGEAVFTVQITSVIRFKISSWDSKRHRMHANCPVRVGPDGSILRSYSDKRCPVYFN
ncbi:NDR1/HIN1-like protein 26 [Salvia miltiorrhiza]|uniref:NDR1/HIN1-like protein 26 n=1 Tax=Salvia miltiorrhiza TaxID=226208 RepID=UPI0025AC3338|nr:NDR1/HIN1-like protein 26 [Salvia miltiorrhiza]